MRWDALQRHGSREQWLAARRIGASDVARILGWRQGAYRLWRRLTGRPLPPLQGAHLQQGLDFERLALVVYEDSTGHEVRRPPPHSLYEGPEPWCTVTPDAFERAAAGEPWGPLEVKTDRDPSRWGDPATVEQWGPDLPLPREYALQAHVQAWALDAPWSRVVVLLPWYDVRSYTLHRDADLEALVVDRCRAWWQRHIVDGVPVAPDDVRDAAAGLAADVAPGRGDVRQATPAEVQLALQLHAAGQVADAAAATRRLLSLRLCESAGRARALLLGRDGRQGRVSIVRAHGSVHARVKITTEGG